MQVRHESAGKVVDAVARPLRDLVGPFQKPLANNDAVSHQGVTLHVRASAVDVFYRS